MIGEPSFFKYLVFDDEGEMIGIDPLAPEEEKEKFLEYIEQKRSGLKL